MKIESALAATERELQSVSDSPRLDAELLLMFVLNAPRSLLFTHPDQELSDVQAARFATLVKQRLDHNPIAYLTGEKEFWSLALTVTPDTLVPRPETELLVEEALKRIPENSALDILDLGTGSGAIAIAIASERPNARIVATDISAPALRIATDNARRHSLTNLRFLQGDWLDAVAEQSFDLILSNPPYVAAGDPALDRLAREPRGALVSGSDGLDAIRQIAVGAGDHLADGGWLFVEHGADQKTLVGGTLTNAGWHDIECLTDLGGLPRLTRSRR